MFGRINSAKHSITGRIVVIKIPKRAAEDDGVWLKLSGGYRDGRQRRNPGGGVFHESLDVAQDVFNRHLGNAPLAFNLQRRGIAPVGSRYVRKVVFIAQQTINDEHAHFIDLFFDRLVTAEGLLIERKRKRGAGFGRWWFFD